MSGGGGFMCSLGNSKKAPEMNVAGVNKFLQGK
jgi:hypothetical protein